MGVLRLPYGPWKPLFGGKYEGLDVTVYQNPDRDLLSVVVDKEGERPKGLVVTFWRFFTLEGEGERVVDAVRYNTLLVVRKRGGKVYRFLGLMEGPRYVGLSPEDLGKAIEEMGNSAYKDTIVLRKVAGALGATLTRLRDADPYTASLLLAEPVLLPKLMGATTKVVEAEPQRFVVLGRTDEDLVKLPAQELRRTLVSGPERRRGARVLVEGFALAGIPVVVITPEPGGYDGMGNAGTKDVKAFGLTPVGFPVNVLELGEYKVDLNVVEPDALIYAFGVKTDGNAAKVIKEALSSLKARIEGIGDVISAIKEPKYMRLRAKRVLKVHALQREKFFGRNDVSTFFTVQELGEVHVLHAEGVWGITAVQSVLEGILKFMEARGRRGGLAVVIERAERYLPPVDSPTVNALARVVRALMERDVYFVLECEDAGFVRREVREKMEAFLTSISGDDFAYRGLARRPLRFRLRPFVSGLTVPPEQVVHGS